MMRPAIPAKRKECSESVSDGAAREPQPDGACGFVARRKPSHQRHAEGRQQDLGAPEHSFTAEVPRHGCVLVKLRAAH